MIKKRRISYVADFRYIERGVVVVEDVKGYDTMVSRLKRAILLVTEGIEVRLIA